MLTAITVALVPLAVRLIYNILSAFSPAPTLSSGEIVSSNPSSSLAKFNSFSGSWQLYLVMFVLMELLVVLIYVIAGMMMPIIKYNDHTEESKAGQGMAYGKGAALPSAGYTGYAEQYRGPRTNQAYSA